MKISGKSLIVQNNFKTLIFFVSKFSSLLQIRDVQFLVNFLNIFFGNFKEKEKKL